MLGLVDYGQTALATEVIEKAHAPSSQVYLTVGQRIRQVDWRYRGSNNLVKMTGDVLVCALLPVKFVKKDQDCINVGRVFLHYLSCFSLMCNFSLSTYRFWRTSSFG
jgi:hypothetical protein